MLTIVMSSVALVAVTVCGYVLYKVDKILKDLAIVQDDVKKKLNIQEQTNRSLAKLQSETSVTLEAVMKRTQQLQRHRFEKQRNSNGKDNRNKVRTR